ncbi:hypothetical protein [Streptomyces bluensis]|uniref:Uncharacterized protein n=1 Tax=Streptomyces bluensis TaxID=33897 RepID=A0ABW6UCY2_9ACTN
MTTRDAETLTRLVDEQAGAGKSMTFVQLAARSVDPETGYQPSANLLWKVASGQDIKINPSLVRAIAAGLGLPPRRVRAAAARQFVGWEASELTESDSELESDEVVQVARAAGVTPDEMPSVQAFFEELRRRRTAEKQ